MSWRKVNNECKMANLAPSEDRFFLQQIAFKLQRELHQNDIHYDNITFITLFGATRLIY
jgi:hypothetical protein